PSFMIDGVVAFNQIVPLFNVPRTLSFFPVFTLRSRTPTSSLPFAMGSIAPQFNVLEGFYNSINGKLTSTEKTRHGINPATGKANPEVPVSTPKDVDDAVAAAKEAFKSWSQTPWEKRQEAALAFAD